MDKGSTGPVSHACAEKSKQHLTAVTVFIIGARSLFLFQAQREECGCVREKAGVAPFFTQISETSLLTSLSSPIPSSISSRKSKKWLETVTDPPFQWLVLYCWLCRKGLALCSLNPWPQWGGWRRHALLLLQHYSCMWAGSPPPFSREAYSLTM